MKKMNILRMAFTLVMAFAFTGVFAQSTDVPGLATDYATTGAVTVMEGTTVPLYALPDAYYHPSYDPDVAGSLTAGFTWDWTEQVTADIAFSNDGVQDNYTQISGMLVANSPYTINVLESAPAGWGGCNDGVGINIAVTVVAQPTATLGGTTTYEGCEGSTGAPSPMNVTIANGWQNYRLAWNLEIKTLNADLSDKDFYDTDKTTVIIPPVLAEEYTQAVPEAVAASGAHDITSIAGGYTYIDNSKTVYTYSLVSINDQASRFGNFIALDGDDTVAGNFTYYAMAETVTITVNPNPTTGPIYHILNTWAN